MTSSPSHVGKRHFPDIPLENVCTYSLLDRPSKVSASDLGRPWTAGGSFSDFLDRLPAILGAPICGGSSTPWSRPWKAAAPWPYAWGPTSSRWAWAR